MEPSEITKPDLVVNLLMGTMHKGIGNVFEFGTAGGVVNIDSVDIPLAVDTVDYGRATVTSNRHDMYVSREMGDNQL